MNDHHDDEYDGPAVLLADGREVPVEVSLRGHFQPIDGRFHWYGRVAASDQVSRLRSGTAVTVRTARGGAAGRLSDVDPWGRPRLTGVGRPPY